MKVFLESEQFGYEEFEADSINEAIQMLRNILNSVFSQEDGIERKIGMVVKPRERKGGRNDVRGLS